MCRGRIKLTLSKGFHSRLICLDEHPETDEQQRVAVPDGEIKMKMKKEKLNWTALP